MRKLLSKFSIFFSVPFHSFIRNGLFSFKKNLGESGTINQLSIKTFLGLKDTPDTYTGKSGYILKVKNTEDGIEFVLSSSGVTDGDKGDISVSNSGATWTIDNKVVTLAKMADMATASLIYRKTAGTGAPEVNSLATLKTDLGLSGTNTGDQNLSGLVPYTGASSNVDLGSHDLTTLTAISCGTLNGLTLLKQAVGFTVEGGQSTSKKLTVYENTTLDGGTHSGTNTGDNAVNSLYSGLVTNATHTGEVTGSGALTVDKTAITGKTTVTAVGADYVLISDTSDSGNLKKALVSDFAGGTDEKVKYDSGDPTAGYVADKVIAGTGISVAEGTGANENKLVVTNSSPNATHTGQVTGATTLTLDKTAISDQTAVTPAGDDYVLIGDTSDTNKLKKALVSDLGLSDGDKGDITVGTDEGGEKTLTIDNGVVTEAKLSLADNTTGNVSTTKHGFAPKGDGSTDKFLNANGAYSIPSGSGTTVHSDLTNLPYDVSGHTGFEEALKLFTATQVSASGITGSGYPHGSCMVGDKIYLGTRTNPAKLFVFNDPENDLTDFDVITLTGFQNLESMFYDSISGFIFGICQRSTAGTQIIKINPADNSFTTLYDASTPVAGNSPAIVSDGTYIYGVTYTSPASFFKIRISDGNLMATQTWTEASTGHAGIIKQYSGRTELYFVASFTTTFGSLAHFAKVDPTDLSYDEIELPIAYATDDIAYRYVDDDGGIVYIGSEGTSELNCAVNTETMTATTFWGFQSYGMFIYDGDLYSTCPYSALVTSAHIMRWKDFDLTNPEYYKINYNANELFVISTGQIFYCDFAASFQMREVTLASAYKTKDSNIDIGIENDISGTTNIGIGKYNIISGRNNVGIGTFNQLSGLNSGADGYNNVVDGEGSFAKGKNNVIDGDNCTVIGFNQVAVGDGIVMIGTATASVTNNNTVAIQNTLAIANNSIGVGVGLVDPIRATSHIRQVTPVENTISDTGITPYKDGQYNKTDTIVMRVYAYKIVNNQKYLSTMYDELTAGVDFTLEEDLSSLYIIATLSEESLLALERVYNGTTYHLFTNANDYTDNTNDVWITGPLPKYLTEGYNQIFAQYSGAQIVEGATGVNTQSPMASSDIRGSLATSLTYCYEGEYLSSQGQSYQVMAPASASTPVTIYLPQTNSATFGTIIFTIKCKAEVGATITPTDPDTIDDATSISMAYNDCLVIQNNQVGGWNIISYYTAPI